MGMSPEGIIYYGYYFSEEDEVDIPDVFSIARNRAEAKGAIPVDYSTEPKEWGPARAAWREEHDDEIQAYYGAIRAEETAIGVDWAVAGSYDFGNHYVYIPASRITAEWSEMQALTDLIAEPDWALKLDSHLSEMGIAKPQDGPRWYLTSLYG